MVPNCTTSYTGVEGDVDEVSKPLVAPGRVRGCPHNNEAHGSVPKNVLAASTGLRRAAGIVAERWTPLVLRELICGSHRFNDRNVA